MFVDELKIAFERLVEKEKNNLLALTRNTGVNNSTVNRLHSQKADFGNLPALTIQRLFPKMKVYFFPEDYPEKKIVVEGNNSGAIAHGERSFAMVSKENLSKRTNERLINQDVLELQILESKYLTTEEQKKFLIFLKREIKL